jgi:putative DNA primase/helicase
MRCSRHSTPRLATDTPRWPVSNATMTLALAITSTGFTRLDEAIRRRFHLIPFGVTIPPEERDPELAEKLKAEWPGILQWMVDGCLEWRTERLQRPEAVANATAAYLESEDAIAAWIDDRCERDPNAWESSTALFGSWTSWATAAGEFSGSSKRFGQALETRGFMPCRKMDGRGFTGLRIAHTEPSQPYRSYSP